MSKQYKIKIGDTFAFVKPNCSKQTKVYEPKTFVDKQSINDDEQKNRSERIKELKKAISYEKRRMNHSAYGGGDLRHLWGLQQELAELTNSKNKDSVSVEDPNKKSIKDVKLKDKRWETVYKAYENSNITPAKVRTHLKKVTKASIFREQEMSGKQRHYKMSNGEVYATNIYGGIDGHPGEIVLQKLVDTNNIKDAKKEYTINWQDTYHKTKDKTRVDANSVWEAVRKFGDIIALGGIGTANCYIVNISPNDGWMRTYGKLSDLLKQHKNDTSIMDAIVSNSTQLESELNKYLAAGDYNARGEADIKGNIFTGKFSWGINGGRILLNYIDDSGWVVKQFWVSYDKNRKINKNELNNAIKYIYKMAEEKNKVKTANIKFSHFSVEFMEGGPTERAWVFVNRSKGKKLSLAQANNLIKEANNIYQAQHTGAHGYLKLYIDMIYNVNGKEYTYHGPRFDIGDKYPGSFDNSYINRVEELIRKSPSQFKTDSSIKDESLKVKVYTINKGQPSQYYGLKLAEKGNEQILPYAPNNWKTQKGALDYAKNKGYTVVQDENIKPVKGSVVVKDLNKSIRDNNRFELSVVNPKTKQKMHKYFNNEKEARQTFNQAVQNNAKNKGSKILITLFQTEPKHQPLEFKIIDNSVKDENIKSVKGPAGVKGWKIKSGGKTFIIQNYAAVGNKDKYEIVELETKKRLMENASITQVKQYAKENWNAKLLDKQYVKDSNTIKDGTLNSVITNGKEYITAGSDIRLGRIGYTSRIDMAQKYEYSVASQLIPYLRNKLSKLGQKDWKMWTAKKVSNPTHIVDANSVQEAKDKVVDSIVTSFGRKYHHFIKNSTKGYGSIMEERGKIYTSAKPGTPFNSSKDALEYSKRQGWKEVTKEEFAKHMWDSSNIKDANQYEVRIVNANTKKAESKYFNDKSKAEQEYSKALTSQNDNSKTMVNLFDPNGKLVKSKVLDAYIKKQPGVRGFIGTTYAVFDSSNKLLKIFQNKQDAEKYIASLKNTNKDTSIKDANTMTISLVVPKKLNYTPASLMIRYAKQKNAQTMNSRYGNTLIKLEGKWWAYDRLKESPVDATNVKVNLSLIEVDKNGLAVR